jgi:hypothetical protein
MLEFDTIELFGVIRATSLAASRSSLATVSWRLSCAMIHVSNTKDCNEKAHLPVWSSVFSAFMESTSPSNSKIRRPSTSDGSFVDSSWDNYCSCVLRRFFIVLKTLMTRVMISFVASRRGFPSTLT